MLNLEDINVEQAAEAAKKTTNNKWWKWWTSDQKNVFEMGDVSDLAQECNRVH